ncbi:MULTISPECIES: AMP-binding protein [unclassified Pseudonocardia]|uniref:AMP-binding protein n=1 Tax=unclassified Pseudonocardia TaxID=2619320 RepID=UPI0001FFE9B3|nr:AMP-binding protein [Pseudonocardia sp. Ae707_Ps1]OLM16307.1 Long-chain-fatty-acid--CoA ligase [Pseudonocardia sp. Ae707_Ps1]
MPGQTSVATDFRLTDILADPGRAHLPAVTVDGAETTYGELDRRAGLAGAALRDLGLGVGDRVVWIGKNRPEFLELLLGAPRIGAVSVPLNTRLTESDLHALVADADAGLVVLGPEFAGLRADLGGRRVLVVGEDYADWRDAPDAPLPPSVPEGTTVDDPVLQLYTSGTTGLPKGVLLAHRQFSALLLAAEHWSIDTTSTALVAMPLFHIGGVGYALVCLAAGSRLVLVADIVPDALLDTMSGERVTNAFLVPAVLQMLVAVPGAADRDWSALRSVAYGASPITAGALRKVVETFRAPLFQVYGATETTGAITQLDPGDHDPDGPRAHLMRSAGRAYPWVELTVVDPATGEQLEAGRVGEVRIRSDQVTSGYWRRPEETATALGDDGRLRTGDAGYLDADGFLFLTDRIKDMIVTGAENVYPIEVENVLSEHPDIADVAVIGVPDERWGEAVKAVVVPRDGATIDPDALLDWMRPLIAGYKRPRSVDVVEALPRNPSGKILKRELRAPYWAGVGRTIG